MHFLPPPPPSTPCDYSIFLFQPDGTELFHFVHGCSSWEAYLASMKTDGTWGDHVILHGAANCFETCIHVISSLPHHHDVWICPEYDVTGSNRLVLGHLNKLHYVSLIPDIGWKDVWLHCNVTFPNLCYQNSNHLNEAAAPFISALFAKVTIKLATKALSLFCGIAACKKLLQKVESSFTVCNRICTCCEFTGQGKLVLQEVSKGECCTGRFATTIFSATQRCNGGTML